MKVKKDIKKIAKKSNSQFIHVSHDVHLYKKEPKKQKTPDSEDLSEIIEISEDQELELVEEIKR